MTFLMVLAVTVAACLALRTPLHKWPVAFYVLAVAADVAYVIGVEGLLPRVVMGPLTLLMGKCVLSLALFVVVMYIGVFAKGSKVHQWLKPVRSELSIIACILACGHMAVYLGSYAPRLGGTLGVNVVSALVVALALLVLLLVLGVTSFGFVKKAYAHRRLEASAAVGLRVLRFGVRAPDADARAGCEPRRRGRCGKRGRVHGDLRCLRRAARAPGARRPACRRGGCHAGSRA